MELERIGLRIQYKAMMGLFLHYNNMVKDARTQYFSERISAHQHNPRFLFKTVNQQINPTPSCASAESDADCEKSYFIDKVESIRACYP